MSVSFELSAAGAARQRHILIVDDEAISVLALQRFLERRGFRVSTAGDGYAALRIQAADPADVVVSDIRMPQLGGRELVAHLRRERPDQKVIIMTGHTLPDEVLGAGGPAVPVLLKPIDAEELLHRLREMTGYTGT
jgi:DNA-binding NtrC family response regulator